MIKNKVYRLKKDEEIGKNMPMKAGQEIEIVMDVVYVNGFMVPPMMQPIFYGWVKNNQDKVEETTKKW